VRFKSALTYYDFVYSAVSLWGSVQRPLQNDALGFSPKGVADLGIAI
jgi:hypothetical protein